ncbi:hypothetical protein [Streptomyces sp. DG2A-72]|uniref:hypothetical protein n=1 Tax=Streptomyces sp. DG2A-72 TaxID=3051386 RepID=UPI003463FDBB
MTGGSVKTGAINRDLATAARETGLAIASGSMHAYFKDPGCADTFRVLRRHNPHGFVLAMLNATCSVDNARRAIDLLQANALDPHQHRPGNAHAGGRPVVRVLARADRRSIRGVRRRPR